MSNKITAATEKSTTKVASKKNVVKAPAPVQAKAVPAASKTTAKVKEKEVAALVTTPVAKTSLVTVQPAAPGTEKNHAVSSLTGTVAGTEVAAAEANDELDPNFLTHLSACIKDVHANGERTFKTFGERLQERAKSKKAKSDEGDWQVNELLANLRNTDDQGELHGALSSPAGLRCLLTVKTPEKLMAYCDVLSVTKADLAFLFNDPANPASSLSKLTMVMALGLYCRTMRETEARGTTLSPAVKSVIAEAEGELAGENEETGEPKSESFQAGINYARRIFSGIKVDRKRGRRPKNYNDQYNTLSLEGADGNGTDVGLPQYKKAE